MVAEEERLPLATSIKEHIDECIQHFAYEDALFLAEMNHDQENSDETLLLLADCYFRTGRLDELFHLLAANTLDVPRLRYIFAACCFELKKHDDCVRALAGTSPLASNRLHPVLAKSSSAPFAYTLLSKLYCKEGRTEDALTAAELSVRLNCLHWSSVQEYLYLGGEKPQEVFDPVLTQFAHHITDENEETEELYSEEVKSEELSREPSEQSDRTASTDRSESTERSEESAQTQLTVLSEESTENNEQREQRKQREDSSQRSVTFADIEDENNEEEEEEDDFSPAHSTPVIAAPSRTVDAPRKTSRKMAAAEVEALSAERRTSLRSTTRSQRTDENDTTKRQSIARAAKGTTSSKSRGTDKGSKSPKRKVVEPKPLGSRNSNLRSTSSSTRPTRVAKVRSTPVGTRGATSSTAAARRPESSSTGRSTPPGAASTQGSTTSPILSLTNEKDAERMANICQRMNSLALVHYHFVNFRLSDAEHEIALMHPAAQDTSQVTLARARIMVEKSAYKSARMLLESHHKRFPYKVDGMEMLSTALWQEQDTHALSSLATSLTSRAKDRAESWCAAANSFSLAKQHSQAVQCLERAIKLNPRFVYSYTLLGCELIEMEELDKAGKAFRAALCVRPRDYRAFYGLAMVNQKKEHLNLAMLDIGKAIEINGQNAVLYCAMSSILHAKNDVNGALLVIDKALNIDKHSVAAHYHKARYLYDVRKYSESLKVLEKLKERASDEANVYFLLGKVHKRLGDTDKALLNFHWASNMDPRGESMLSDLGEHLEEEGSSHT